VAENEWRRFAVMDPGDLPCILEPGVKNWEEQTRERFRSRM
jgi:hypothetical protein